MKGYWQLFLSICLFAPLVSKGQITFIKNEGQWVEQVLYSAELPGGKVFLKKNGLTYSFYDAGFVNEMHFDSHNEGSRLKNMDVRDLKIQMHSVDVSFEGANLEPKMLEGTKVKTRHNYFLGNDKSKWASNVRSYESILYEEIYEGIDLVMYSLGNSLKYDFRLSPGSDPTKIRIKYDGASSVSRKDGKIQICTSVNEILEVDPISFQTIDDDECIVPTEFELEGDVVSFRFPDGFNNTQSLIIDPLLIFSTYSGSAADNWGNTATFDEAGNLYAGGMTNHQRGGVFLGQFPATPGAYQTSYGGIWDVAISKYDSTGSDLIYATYLGGSESEVPQSLIVDKNGDLLILGITGSTNFPIGPNAYDSTFNGGDFISIMYDGTQYNGTDIFVAKLSSDGSELIASTYIGGTGNDGILSDDNYLSRNYGDQSRGDVNVGTDNSIFFASRTSSNNFPIVGGVFNSYNGGPTDGIVAKMSSDLSEIIWSTYLGGNQDDVALSIKLDSADGVYVAGGTSSPNFPTTADVLNSSDFAFGDGFVVHLSPEGDSLIAGTFIGTSSYDQVYFMDLDAKANVYVAGQTEGPYTITPGVFSSGFRGQFLHKLTNDLSTTIFSTVIASPNTNRPNLSLTAFLVNDCDNIYLSGWGSANSVLALNNSSTLGLPTTSDAFKTTTTGEDFYLVVLNGDASQLLYATFFGGSAGVHVDGGTSRFDKRGIVYHSVCASCALDDSSFPTTAGSWSEVNGSRGCNNGAFKFDLASLSAGFNTNDIELMSPGISKGCAPFEVVFQNHTIGGKQFDWDFGDGTLITLDAKTDTSHVYEEAGTYEVILRAFDPNTCVAEDWAYGQISVFETNFSIEDDRLICGGSSTQLEASGGSTYKWFPVTGLDNPFRSNPVATPDTTTLYHLVSFDANGCLFQDSILVEVIPEIILDVGLDLTFKCNELPIINLWNHSENADSVIWEFEDGQISNEWEPSYEFLTSGGKTIKATVLNEFCSKVINLPVNIQPFFVPNVITPNQDGVNDQFEISSIYDIDLVIFNRWGRKLYEMQSYDNSWGGENLVAGLYYFNITFADDEMCNGWVSIMR